MCKILCLVVTLVLFAHSALVNDKLWQATMLVATSGLEVQVLKALHIRAQ